jgi:uncharacterized protein (TIGR02757 family)
MNKNKSTKQFLDHYYQKYNNQAFIPSDPISIPHKFTRLQDIEISGFWIAMLAWGQRKTIINKGLELMNLMDNAPYDFVRGCTDNDLKPLLKFKHRTFNATDTLYFIDFFRRFYLQHHSLEQAFLNQNGEFIDMRSAISDFHRRFFNVEYAPDRTRKHVATPERNSACKRINMFLRWMVRKDNQGVDFGCWHQIRPGDLICPCDVHVERTARKLGLITIKNASWNMAEELTAELKKYDPVDPVKYDFALFGVSVLN